MYLSSGLSSPFRSQSFRVYAAPKHPNTVHLLLSKLRSSHAPETEDREAKGTCRHHLTEPTCTHNTLHKELAISGKDCFRQCCISLNQEAKPKRINKQLDIFQFGSSVRFTGQLPVPVGTPHYQGVPWYMAIVSTSGCHVGFARVDGI